MLATVTKTSVHSSAHASRRENRIVPLYHQVEQVIRHRIATRQYASGLQIPSEHELGRELKVSRVTIREALRELVRENLLVKVQGKGTFVAPDLPKFVYNVTNPAGRANGLVLPGYTIAGKTGMTSRQRMETPVIYFYSEQERSVDVDVQFNGGPPCRYSNRPILTSATTLAERLSIHPIARCSTSPIRPRAASSRASRFRE